MITFNTKKKLIFSSIFIFGLLLIVFINFGLYFSGGKFLAAEFIKTMTYILLIAFLLIFRDDFSLKTETVILSVLTFISPFLIFQMTMELMGIEGYLPEISRLNLLFFIVPIFALFFITHSPKISIITTSVLAYGFHLANELVIMFRGTAIIPSDFLAIGTAATVAGSYEAQMNFNLINGTLFFIVIIISASKLKFRMRKLPQFFISKAVSLVIAVVCLLSITAIDVYSISVSTFDQISTNTLNGVPLSFYVNLKKMKVNKPDGYDKEGIKEFLSSYTPDEVDPDLEKPNIIVVMNESFADLRELGDFDLTEENMSFFYGLDNTIRGELFVSAYAGGTCNTEFEFLTGASMLTLPQGSYPYMQYLTEYMPSLVSQLEGLGYKTAAIHPFWGHCWKRNRNYQLLGFDKFISGEYFSQNFPGKYINASKYDKLFGDDLDYIRNLISDKESYKQIIKQFEEKEDGEKLFVFNVTMQNHSSYTYDGTDFTTDVKVDSELNFPMANQYFTLMKHSDEALEELITYFQSYDEKTVILFFGDHQPKVDDEFYDYIFNKPAEELTTYEFLSKYKTPFFIWANYDIEDKDVGLTSPNFLSTLLLETCELPLSSWNKFLKDIQKDYPSMNYFGAHGLWQLWLGKGVLNNSRNDIMNKYQQAVYYLLFDYDKSDIINPTS